MRIKRLMCILSAAAVLVSLNSCGKSSSSQLPSTTGATAAGTTMPTTAKPTIPLREPQTLGTMTMNDLFYKPKQATVIYIVDTNGMTDTRIAMLRCLQGLVARYDSAAIFLSNNETDVFWYNHTKNEYGTVFKKITSNELLEKYKDLIKSIVIYDKEKSYQYAAALALASVQDGLAVDKNLYGTISKLFDKGIQSQATNYTDLSRVLTSAESAIKWTINNCYDKALHNYIGIIDIESEMADYLYATKSIALFVDKSDGKQVETFKLLLKKQFTQPAVIIGGAEDFTDIASPFGFCYLNFNSFSNSTFLSSFPNNSKLPSQPFSADKRAKDGNIYIAINIVDNKMLSSAKIMDNIMNSPVRGNTPISVAINPAICELAPPVLKWFYQSKGSSTVLVSSSFGYSNINANSFNKNMLESWSLTNQQFLKRSGVNILSVNKKISDKSAETISEHLNVEGYLCSDIDKSKYINGVPFIKSITLDDLEEIKDYKLSVPADEAKFFCININVTALGEKPFDALDALVTKYQMANDGNVEFLLADDLAKTMKNHFIDKTDVLGTSGAISAVTATATKNKP